MCSEHIADTLEPTHFFFRGVRMVCVTVVFGRRRVVAFFTNRPEIAER